MKKNLLTLLLIFSALLAQSQSKATLDIVLGTDYTNKTWPNPLTSTIPSSFNTKGTGKINFRGGVNFNLRFFKNMWLKSGLRIASVGYKAPKVTDIRYGSELGPNGVYTPDPTLPHEFQAIVDHWYFEIPLLIRYEMLSQKWKPFVEFGLSPHIYFNSRIINVTDISRTVDNSFSDSSYFNRVQLAGVVSAGLGYQLNDKLGLFGQIVSRYHFTELEKSSENGSNQYSMGIEFGTRIGI